MNSKNKTVLVTSAVAVAVGVGIVLVIKNRQTLKRQLLQVCNASPLKTREIQIANSLDEAKAIARRLKTECQDYSVLGFDCEWLTVSGKRRPVSLLQLSSHTGLCALFRLCHMKAIPLELRELLEDENILKVGVAPNDDAAHMAYDFSVGVACTLDLRYLADLAGCKGEGLAKMSAEHLNITLDKNWRIRCSDWEAKELTESQIDYASKDALVAIELFKKFVDRIDPIYPWTNTKRVLDGVLGNVHMYVDHKYMPTKQIATNNNKREKKSLLKAKNPVAKETKRTFASRANPLYDNCYMEAPDGELLCTCDKQKAEWYIMKDLATKVKEEPLTIRLNFEPKGRAVGEVGQYYLQEKENQCVVCGRKESYVRKNVVPREYRKFFPEILKNHTSHDVQLLCTHCHQVSDMSDIRVRRQLTLLCNAPMSTQEGGKKSVENPKLKALRNAARALLYNGDKIPESRKRELRERLADHVPDPTADEIPDHILCELANMAVTEENKDFLSHAERVVKHFTVNGGLVELEKMWRRHFLDTMKPRFLPNLWSVDHNTQRLEIRADEGRCTKDDLLIAGVDPAKLNVGPNENTSTPVRPIAATPSMAVTEDSDEKSDTDSNCTLKDQNDLDTDDEADFASVYQSGVDGSQYGSNSTLASWKTGRSSYHDTNSVYKSDGESTYSFKSCDDDDQTIRDYDSEASDASTLSQNSNKSVQK